MREVTLDMETNITMNKIHVNIEHTLIITNVSASDCGLYFCMGLEGQESEKKYNYLIDSIIFFLMRLKFEFSAISILFCSYF